MIQIASAIRSFSQGAQEDGTVAGEGLSAVETFTYFFAAPTVFFIGISVIVFFTNSLYTSFPNASKIR